MTLISFGLDKCAKATFKRRKLTRTTSKSLIEIQLLNALNRRKCSNIFLLMRVRELNTQQ